MVSTCRVSSVIMLHVFCIYSCIFVKNAQDLVPADQPKRFPRKPPNRQEGLQISNSESPWIQPKISSVGHLLPPSDKQKMQQVPSSDKQRTQSSDRKGKQSIPPSDKQTKPTSSSDRQGRQVTPTYHQEAQSYSTFSKECWNDEVNDYAPTFTLYHDVHKPLAIHENRKAESINELPAPSRKGNQII